MQATNGNDINGSSNDSNKDAPPSPPPRRPPAEDSWPEDTAAAAAAAAVSESPPHYGDGVATSSSLSPPPPSAENEDDSTTAANVDPAATTVAAASSGGGGERMRRIRDWAARAIKSSSEAIQSHLHGGGNATDGDDSDGVGGGAALTVTRALGELSSRLRLQPRRLAADFGFGEGWDWNRGTDDSNSSNNSNGDDDDDRRSIASSFFRFSDGDEIGSDGDYDGYSDGGTVDGQDDDDEAATEGTALLPTDPFSQTRRRRGSRQRPHRRRRPSSARARRQGPADPHRPWNGNSSSNSSSSSRAGLFRLLPALGLIFINFTFVVAALVLLMAGVATVSSSATAMCGPCRWAATAAIVLGSVQMLASLWGFLCLRQRSAVGLLLYAATLVLLLVALTVVIAVAAGYNAEGRFPAHINSTYMLRLWEAAVSETYRGGNSSATGSTNGSVDDGDSGASVVLEYSWPPAASGDVIVDDGAGSGASSSAATVTVPPLPPAMDGPHTEHAACRTQREFRCSGFYYGCCRPGVCYGNSADDGSSRSEDGTSLPSSSSHSSSTPSMLRLASPLPPPWWVRRVCPRCPDAPPEEAAPRVCSAEVYATVRRNLTGFLAMTGYAWLLMAAGCTLAGLARRVAAAGNRARAGRASQQEHNDDSREEQQQQRRRRHQRQARQLNHPAAAAADDEVVAG